MLKHIFCIVLLLFTFSSSLYSQEYVFEEASRSGGFQIESIETVDSFSVENISYPVFKTKTKNSSKHLLVVSPVTGKQSKVWIGEETNLSYKNYNVRVSKGGTFFYLKISANTGNPYPVYLKRVEKSSQK